MTSATPVTDLSQLYKAAIGEKNQTYYLEKFMQFDEKGVGFQPSWNWGACVGTGGWALYRRMYGWFFVLVAIQIIIGIAVKIHPFFGLLEVVQWLCFAVFANSIYHRKVNQQIISAQKSNEDEHAVIRYLSNRGGVHTWVLYVIGTFWIMLVIAVVVFTFKNTATVDAETTKAVVQATKENAKNIDLPVAPATRIDTYVQALRINPEDAKAWFALGNTYFETKQHPQAISAYQQALRIDPEDAAAWNSLGNTYFETKQNALRINPYQQALRINPEDANVWINLGSAYYDTKQFPQAINAFQQALRINPVYAIAWYNLGVTYADTKQHTQAINAYQQALRINPEYAAAWYNLGVTYSSAGNRDKVIEAYKKLKPLDPALADKFFNALILPGG